MWASSVQFHTPSSVLVAGPSDCGKTVFTRELVLNNLNLFEIPPSTIHYCYGAWQEGFKPLQEEGIVFHEGIPETEKMIEWFPHGGLLIMDDLMDEGSGDKRVLDLFTKYSHHQNVTVIYLCQDMFPNGKYAKSISHNAHYVVAFKNPRGRLRVRNLFLQSFPSTWKEVMEVFRQTTSRRGHPSSSDEVRLLSHLLKHEGWTRCHQEQHPINVEE